jgi:hypothetical protein
MKNRIGSDTFIIFNLHRTKSKLYVNIIYLINLLKRVCARYSFIPTRHDHLRNWACDAIKIKLRNLGSWTGKVWLLKRDKGAAGVGGAGKAEGSAGVRASKRN